MSPLTKMMSALWPKAADAIEIAAARNISRVRSRIQDCLEKCVPGTTSQSVRESRRTRSALKATLELSALAGNARPGDILEKMVARG